MTTKIQKTSAQSVKLARPVIGSKPDASAAAASSLPLQLGGAKTDA
jgi:hypothetical protein